MRHRRHASPTRDSTKTYRFTGTGTWAESGGGPLAGSEPMCSGPRAWAAPDFPRPAVTGRAVPRGAMIGGAMIGGWAAVRQAVTASAMAIPQ